MSDEKPTVDEQVRVVEELRRRGWRIVKLDGPRNPAVRNEPLYAIEDEL